MNQLERKFKSAVTVTVNKLHPKPGRFYAEFHLDDLYRTVLHDDDTIDVIVGKAVEHLCSGDDNAFNGNQIGLACAMNFLRAETLAPPAGDRLAECGNALVALVKKPFTQEDIAKWVRDWYTI